MMTPAEAEVPAARLSGRTPLCGWLTGVLTGWSEGPPRGRVASGPPPFGR
ncbi:MAG: hypothetical protein JWO38_8230 [Gemmataceae bacterium]|nr:hypothetical protein [Gemmataceae bacterium]